MPRDERTYITVHDGMPEHPKIEGLSDGAFRALVDLWCWCSRNHTDGRVTQAVWLKRTRAGARRELVAAGLVHPDGTDVAMHDYLEHQRSTADIDKLRQRRAEAGAKGGRARAKKQATRQANASAFAEQTGSKTQADTDTDTPEPKNGSGSPPTARTLVAEWVDHCGDGLRPPNRVIGQVAKELGLMLGEGIPYPDVRAGLAAWHSRGLHPSALASVVHESRTAGQRAPAPRGRPAPAADFAATLDLGARLQAEHDARHDPEPRPDLRSIGGTP